MNLFKCAAVCVVVAICGCDQGQPTAPVATNNAEPAQLPEFTNSIGMKFKLIPTGMFTMGGGHSLLSDIKSASFSLPDSNPDLICLVEKGPWIFSLRLMKYWLMSRCPAGG